MGGRIIYIPPAAHRCSNMPVPERMLAGTQWQCDQCHEKWVVVTGAQYNETYSAWRKLTGSNMDGRDR